MPLRTRRSRPRRRPARVVALALVGAAIGAGAALARRAGLDRRLGLRTDDATGGGEGVTTRWSDTATPGLSTTPALPTPSNYDVGGPPSNTATPVPVPPPAAPAEIDEEAEVAAAEAEAAGIGGPLSPYATDDPLMLEDEEALPLLEGGEGVSEGMEQAEGELVDAAGPSDTASPYQQQIDEVIEQQDNPFAGESDEAFDAVDTPVDIDQPGDDQGASSTGASSDAANEDRDPGSSSERDDRP